MKIARFILFLSFVAASTPLLSQSTEIKKEPAKAWIRKVDIDKNALPPEGQESAYYYLLLDVQENVPAQERYIHYAYKILTNEGVQQMSDLDVEFDPTYEQVTFHTVSIYREGKIIDRLPKQIRTIQREESMDRHLYDGSYTAVVNLVDVRVGDVVEYAYTLKGYNPVYDGYISRKINLNYGDAYEKAFNSLIVPTSLELSFKNINTDIKPEVDKKENRVTYTWSTDKVKGFITDKHEPEWYDPYSYVLVTNFKNWAEMAAWCVKRYAVSDEDMQVVKTKIYPQFTSNTTDEYALRVIRFVQDEVRYLGFESGLNSHKPHAPAEVFDQRFGDCKDKSLLLSTLLTAGGIESYPVLVNTYYRDKISEQLPSTNAFNHCVVQIRLNDRLFYIDPTINNQGGTLDQYHFPAYGKGLVVNNASTSMVDLHSSAHSSVSEVQTFDIDSIGGNGIITVQTTYTGSEADNQRSYFSQNSKESILKNFLTYYSNTYPDIEELQSILTDDDRDSNIFVVKEKYKIPAFWKPYEDQSKKVYCEFYAQALSDYFDVSKSTKRKAPYRIQHPLDYSHKVIINLPEEWNVTPERQSIKSDYYEYDYEVKYAENQISLFTHYKTKQSSVPTNDFPKFVEHHGKMRNNLSYSLSYDSSVVERSSSKTPGAVVSIVSLLLGAWFVLWLYRNYDPKPYYPAAWGQPIGGWLILVAIGISITPIRLLYSFLTEDYILDGRGWVSMWYANNYGYSMFLVLEHIYNVFFLLFAILIMVLFYKRRSSVPFLISIFYGASCIVSFLDTMLALQIDPGSEVDHKEIIRSVVAAAIWIPYFQMSQRVKKTFVNTHEDPQPDQLDQQPQ